MTVTGRILIIDDEAVLRQTLTRILQTAGYEVTSAASASEGIAYASSQQFDLIYLDIRMPEMSGLDALKIIRQNSPFSSVVLFTAQPDLTSALQAIRDGATDYLLKPLKPQLILDRTQALLARQEKERHKRSIQSRIEALQAELANLENDKASPAAPMVNGADADERFFVRGKLTLDLHTRRVLLGHNIIDLPPTSFDYLLVLARHAPQIVDYQTLVAEAQGYQADLREAQELVKWHVHHIRRAIEPKASRPTYLINVRGTGYRLVAD